MHVIRQLNFIMRRHCTTSYFPERSHVQPLEIAEHGHIEDFEAHIERPTVILALAEDRNLTPIWRNSVQFQRLQTFDPGLHHLEQNKLPLDVKEIPVKEIEIRLDFRALDFYQPEPLMVFRKKSST